VASRASVRPRGRSSISYNTPTVSQHNHQEVASVGGFTGLKTMNRRKYSAKGSGDVALQDAIGLRDVLTGSRGLRRRNIPHGLLLCVI
jgi:hypothetical protein